MVNLCRFCLGLRHRGTAGARNINGPIHCLGCHGKHLLAALTKLSDEATVADTRTNLPDKGCFLLCDASDPQQSGREHSPNVRLGATNERGWAPRGQPARSAQDLRRQVLACLVETDAMHAQVIFYGKMAASLPSGPCARRPRCQLHGESLVAGLP